MNKADLMFEDEAKAAAEGDRRRTRLDPALVSGLGARRAKAPGRSCWRCRRSSTVMREDALEAAKRMQRPMRTEACASRQCLRFCAQATKNPAEAGFFAMQVLRAQAAFSALMRAVRRLL
jgi:hypothetical protein